MDLLKQMIANRAKMAEVHDPKPRSQSGRKISKTERAKSIGAGSRAMRSFIIEEKPGKKVVKEHLEAIIAVECASSDED